MSRTHISHDFTMKRTAIKLLQVSAAYFAIGSVHAPGLGHHPGLSAGRPPLTTSRVAAGAWPMSAVPVLTPRKRGATKDGHAHFPGAANDEIA